MLPLELCRRLTNGLYVVGVAHGGQRDGFTAAWLTQVSFDPLLVALSINPSHASFPILVAAGAFAVSILSHGQLELARHFGTQSGRAVDKLAGHRWQPAHGGAPVLLDALGYLECGLVGRYPAGGRNALVHQWEAGVHKVSDRADLHGVDLGRSLARDERQRQLPARYRFGSASLAAFTPSNISCASVSLAHFG